MAANDTESSIPLQDNSGYSTSSSVGLPASIELAFDQTRPSRFDAFVNPNLLNIPDLFGELSLPPFGEDMLDNVSQGNSHAAFESMAVDDQIMSNPDWLSPIPRSNEIGTSGLPLYEFPPSLNINRTEVTTEATHRPKHHQFALEVPPQLVNELVEIYFDKVQSFLPLFHKHRFVETYLSTNSQINRRYDTLSGETALILHGMLALSARFSSSPKFDGILPAQRGEPFGRRAKAIYDHSIHTLQQPTVRYLQGCILLAFYLYSSGPDSQGWLVIGMCSRLAYDLGLNKVDETNLNEQQSQDACKREWSMREELRRAWWCVWELDAFASGVACRPPTIDMTRFQVLLPVSDEAWFADCPVQSVTVDPDPLHAWCTLRDCQNQDERAWFLVINFVMVLAHGLLLQQKKPDPQQIRDIETAVACYGLILPPQFHLGSGSILFNPQSFRKSNWIILTNLMLQTRKHDEEHPPEEICSLAELYERQGSYAMNSQSSLKKLSSGGDIGGQPVKNIALAGATGTLGTAILQTLLSSGDFFVTVLTQKTFDQDFPPSVKVISINYESGDSISAALQGQDVLISCLGTAAIAKQRLLIDAAIAANIKRFIPSEFGSDLQNLKARSLPNYRQKAAIEDYLTDRSREGRMTYTLIYNGAFLDWAIKAGLLIDLRGHKVTLYDGGDRPVSATRLSTVGKAVVGVLNHYDETANRAIYVQDIAISQKRLLEIAQKLTPEETWTVETADTAQMEAEAREQLSKGSSDPRIWYAFVKRAGFGDGYGSHFQELDNDLLGIPEMTEGEIESLMASLMGQDDPSFE
ncbi:hypothetical protein AYO22_03476 [Fonsecaea multimorphosa]|nr:hypothetical protein AYO22_03476 [Fonsecaea multimorphosa]